MSVLAVVLVGTYDAVQVAVAPVPARVHGDPVNVPEVPALLVKLIVPVGVIAVPGEVSVTVAVQVVDDPALTGEVQETLVVVVLATSILTIMPGFVFVPK